MLKLIFLNNIKTLVTTTKLFFLACILSFLYSEIAYSENYIPKTNINGSGLKIPRFVSLKNSLTYMRSGPGKKYPIIFEIKQKGYPLIIVSEFNNWRRVINSNNLSGWIHTQMLSSFRTGVIIKNTLLKTRPSKKSKAKAKLLVNLLVNVKKCKLHWCEIEIVKNKVFVGWIKKTSIWGVEKK